MAFRKLQTVLSYIVLVRGMQVHAFGVYNLFYSFIPVITTLASFGLEQTLRRFQPEYLRTGQTSGERLAREDMWPARASRPRCSCLPSFSSPGI